MSTPPYAPPSIGQSGLIVPSYQSILADNLQAYRNIYGQNQYTAPDSAIYQLLSILSLKQADANLGLQLAYNQSSPATAVGAGLDRVIKMNGLVRDPFTFSTAPLTLTGTPNFVVTNGFAQDQQGNLWSIPSPTTITGGSVTVIGQCTTPGNVQAPAGTINIISTPQGGWTTVNNGSAATPGAPIEPDSQVRATQAISVALPALTPIAATLAAVLAVKGVTRINPGTPTPSGPGTSVENPTGSTDSWGNPAHSISVVAEGGVDLDVATAIFDKKTIGCFTHGTTSVAVTDSNTGYTETISFYRPTYLPIFVLCVVHGYAGTVTTAVLSSIQTSLTNYLNALQIGETVSVAALSYEAMAINASLPQPTFGVQTLQIGTVSVSTTATVVISTNTITVASATGIAIGQLILGVGIPAGTTVSNVVGTTVTMSANATASGSGVAVTFATISAADVSMPNFYDVAEGVLANVSVSQS